MLVHGDSERPERKQNRKKSCMSMREGGKPSEGYKQRKMRSYHMAQEKKKLWEVAGRWRSLWEVTHSSKDEQERYKNQNFREGKESGWGLRGSCCTGGSNCDNSLRFLVRTLCWLHTDLDESCFCKWQDQATRILFNQPDWLRDNISMHVCIHLSI